jgi:thiamine-phosphate pyrophosphorylase
MPSDLEVARVARLARALNPLTHLPPLILMTDERVRDPVAAVKRLVRGSAVIVRHRDRDSRKSLVAILRPVTRARGVLLLISEDGQLAQSMGADGLHLPERQSRTALHWKAIRPKWLITTAAHSAEAVAIAARAGADAALLGPVFPTRSHPGRANLGIFCALGIAARAPLPVYALGGINAGTARRLAETGIAGFAAIEGLTETHNA